MREFARNDASFQNRDLEMSPGLQAETILTNINSYDQMASRPSETESRQISELIKHANRARTHMSTQHSRGRTEQHSGVGFIEESGTSETHTAKAKGAVDVFPRRMKTTISPPSAGKRIMTKDASGRRSKSRRRSTGRSPTDASNSATRTGRATHRRKSHSRRDSRSPSAHNASLTGDSRNVSKRAYERPIASRDFESVNFPDSQNVGGYSLSQAQLLDNALLANIPSDPRLLEATQSIAAQLKNTQVIQQQAFEQLESALNGDV